MHGTFEELRASHPGNRLLRDPSHLYRARLTPGSETRQGTQRVLGVANTTFRMDRHHLGYVQVDTARAYDVGCLVGVAVSQFARVTFRPRAAHGSRLSL